MKQVVLLIFIGFTVVFAYSQEFSSEVFHDGFYVTINKDTVRCKIKYNLELNVITTDENEKISSFSSQKVFYFQIEDNIHKRKRKFYSIPYYVKPKYKLPIFFELIYEGKYSIISRERIILETINTGAPYWGGGNGTRKVVDYSYYFLDRKGNITYYSGKKKDLLLIMLDKSNQIRSFIKKEHLRSDYIKDLVQITQEYNSLIK